MASKPLPPDKQKLAAEEAAELEDKLTPAKPDLEDDEADDDEEDDELELDDDDEDEDLVVFTAREAAGALATILGFVKPFLVNYKRMLSFVAFGVVVETLFNVIMPLSLKYLIDDALGEEDFNALYIILSVLAVAGIITSIVAIWYERWDARLAASIISSAREIGRWQFLHMAEQFFARTKRGDRGEDAGDREHAEDLVQRLEVLLAERVVDQVLQAERHDDVEQRLDDDAERHE